MSGARQRLYRAAWVLSADGRWIEGGGVLVRGGRIERLLGSAAAVRRAGRAARRIDLGEGALLPGFVDAHAHLELSGLGGRLPARRGFAAWIAALITARGARAPQLASDWEAGARLLLAGGTTLVGDIDSSGAVESGSRRVPLRVRRYREALDAGAAARAAGAVADLSRARRRAGLYEGLSPHAPYTVSPELWARLGRLARARRLHVQVHWAEVPAEERWLLAGAGPFSALLRHSPRRAGLELIEEAGLLGPRTALVHANCARPAERARIAAAGATVVHCPGTQAFFGREPFDLRAWLEAGVHVALGTDSLASNEGLDMRRELALLRRAHPWLAPERALALATSAAARALGLAGRAGEISPGAFADLALHETGGGGPRALLEEISAGRSRLRAVFVGGRPVVLEPAASTGKRPETSGTSAGIPQ